MSIFSSKAEFDLERHLQNVVGRCCEELPEKKKSTLLGRVISDEGNKRYARRHFPFGSGLYIAEKDGNKIYEQHDLSRFPDWKSNKDFPGNEAYPLDSKEHREGVKKIEDLIEKFTANDSNVAKDLKKLLENSEIHYRVLSKWEKPNGSCSFKRAKQKDAKNQIVICICDLNKTGDEVLPEILAHELGHALEFSQRPKGAETKYMDGCETAADILGASLLVNAGVNSKGFSKFMGQDYRDKKTKKLDTKMFYSPDGKYRRTNFILAYKYMYKARKNNSKSLETENRNKIPEKKNIVEQIKAHRGLASKKTTADKPQSVSAENSKNFGRVPNYNDGGR